VEARDIALMQARGRIAFGAGFLLAPGPTGRGWIGDDATSPAVKVLTRALGIRDLALGLGVVIAIDRGAPVRGWLEAGAVSDAVDLLATLRGSGAIPDRARNGVALIAAASAVLCAALSRALDEPPAASAGQSPEAVLTGHPA
jgi:hypothetical protein